MPQSGTKSNCFYVYYLCRWGFTHNLFLISFFSKGEIELWNKLHFRFCHNIKSAQYILTASFHFLQYFFNQQENCCTHSILWIVTQSWIVFHYYGVSYSLFLNSLFQWQNLFCKRRAQNSWLPDEIIECNKYLMGKYYVCDIANPIYSVWHGGRETRIHSKDQNTLPAAFRNQKPILNFAPRGKIWSHGWVLSPRGEVIPWGWNSLFAPPFFKTVERVHPWGWTKEWTFPLGGQISPLGAKFTLGGQGWS
jgi:hypothetical protein